MPGLSAQRGVPEARTVGIVAQHEQHPSVAEAAAAVVKQEILGHVVTSYDFSRQNGVARHLLLPRLAYIGFILA
jgi:hypothetical protein